MNLPLNTSANTSDPVAQARYNMIEQQIRPWNVLDADVLELLSVVRREDFVPAAYRSLAFADIEVPLLGNDAEEAVRQGHSMLQPRIEARILQDVKILPTDRVLEIGAGVAISTVRNFGERQQVPMIRINPLDYGVRDMKSVGLQLGALDGLQLLWATLNAIT